MQEMISQNKIKQISFLSEKKYRISSGMFLVEGEKVVREALKSIYKVEDVICRQEFAEQFSDLNQDLLLCNSKQETKISSLKTPPGIYAVLRIPNQTEQSLKLNGLVLMLDGIGNPGNMGTIIRTAEWFGIEQIICTPSCVDVYNPKVVQASMGSFLRPQISVKSIADLNALYNKVVPEGKILAADMGGIPVSEAIGKSQSCLLIMGSESHGLSDEAKEIADSIISIQKYGGTSNETESLNVGIASGILMSSLRALL